VHRCCCTATWGDTAPAWATRGHRGVGWAKWLLCGCWTVWPNDAPDTCTSRKRAIHGLTSSPGACPRYLIVARSSRADLLAKQLCSASAGLASPNLACHDCNAGGSPPLWWSSGVLASLTSWELHNNTSIGRTSNTACLWRPFLHQTSAFVVTSRGIRDNIHALIKRPVLVPISETSEMEHRDRISQKGRVRPSSKSAPHLYGGRCLGGAEPGR